MDVWLDTAPPGVVELPVFGVTDAGPIVCGAVALLLHAAARTNAATTVTAAAVRVLRRGPGARVRVAVSRVPRIVTPE